MGEQRAGAPAALDAGSRQTRQTAGTGQPDRDVAPPAGRPARCAVGTGVGVRRLTTGPREPRPRCTGRRPAATRTTGRGPADDNDDRRTSISDRHPRPPPRAAANGPRASRPPAARPSRRTTVWHADVDAAAGPPAGRRPTSRSIGAGDGVHADFGAGPVGRRADRHPVHRRSAPGRPGSRSASTTPTRATPAPTRSRRDAPIEGGPDADGDRHVLVVDRDAAGSTSCSTPTPTRDGSWHAGSGAVFDLRSNACGPPAGPRPTPPACRSSPAWSATTRSPPAHRPRHPLHGAAHASNAYVWPARHAASDSGDAALPPMGLRLRLRADVDISRPPAAGPGDPAGAADATA